MLPAGGIGAVFPFSCSGAVESFCMPSVSAKSSDVVPAYALGGVGLIGRVGRGLPAGPLVFCANADCIEPRV